VFRDSLDKQVLANLPKRKPSQVARFFSPTYQRRLFNFFFEFKQPVVQCRINPGVALDRKRKTRS
jgi:hypothetical protein